MTKTPQLISKDSPLYLKRLTRELNYLSDGFYYKQYRCLWARLRGGILQVKAYFCGKWQWMNTDTFAFVDVYSREVVASRVK